MKIIENFLSESLFTDIEIFGRSQNYVRTNLTSWKKEVTGASGVIIVIDLPRELAIRIRAELRPHVPIDYHDIDWFPTIHIGGRDSYIPWHDDGHYGLSVTAYLCDWNREYAGYFLYEDGDEVKCIVPKKNVGLIYHPPMMHAVALSNVFAPLRMSLQIFVAHPSSKEDG